MRMATILSGAPGIAPLRGIILAIFALAQPPTAQKPIDPARIAAVEQLLTAKMAEARIPGLSVAIVVDGRLAWSQGYGLADLENFVPATATTA